MLLGGAGDLQVHVADHGDRVADFAQGLDRLLDLPGVAVGLGLARVHGGDHATGTGLDAFDHQANFLHRILGAFGQVAHFIGDHRKAATAFAGTGRFNRRVEGQQVGLFGDAADHFQHRADLFAVHRQGFDFGHGLADFVGQLIDVAGAALDD
ncbi:hypothetical protein D9M71_482440 [compost metagenome]